MVFQNNHSYVFKPQFTLLLVAACWTINKYTYYFFIPPPRYKVYLTVFKQNATWESFLKRDKLNEPIVTVVWLFIIKYFFHPFPSLSLGVPERYVSAFEPFGLSQDWALRAQKKFILKRLYGDPHRVNDDLFYLVTAFIGLRLPKPIPYLRVLGFSFRVFLTGLSQKGERLEIRWIFVNSI